MIGIIGALVLLVFGAAEIVVGVWKLFGEGWGLIVLGWFSICAGVIFARGIR